MSVLSEIPTIDEHKSHISDLIHLDDEEND